MRLLAGIDLHRVTNLHRERPVRGDCIGGDDACGYPRGRRDKRSRDVSRYPADNATQHKQAYRCRHLRQLPISPTLPLFEQVCDTEVGRYWPAGLLGESRTQCLPLFRKLREPGLRLGMRSEVVVDGRGALGRQPAIDVRVQLVLFDGPFDRRHLTLVSAVLRRCGSPFTSPFI